MNINALVCFTLLFVSITNAVTACKVEYTDHYGGTLSSGNGIVSDSRNGNVSFSWDVRYYPEYDLWVYNYNLSLTRNKIDYVAVEVSDNFTGNDLVFCSPIGGTTKTKNMGITDFDPDNSSYSGIPDEMHGMVFSPVNKYSYSFQIVTSRVPVWGDFFAKLKNPKTFVYNLGFGDPDGDFDLYAVSDGSLNYHILRPDTVQKGESVPEPNTIILIISAIIFSYRKKYFKKSFCFLTNEFFCDIFAI